MVDIRHSVKASKRGGSELGKKKIEIHPLTVRSLNDMKRKLLAASLVPLLIPGCVGPTSRQYAQACLMGSWGIYAVTLWVSRPPPPHRVGRFYWTWMLAAFYFGNYLYGAYISAGHGIGDWQGPSLAWVREVFLGGLGILVLGTILAILYAPIAWVMA